MPRTAAVAVAAGASGAHARTSVSPSAARAARVLHRESAAYHPSLYRHVSQAWTAARRRCCRRPVWTCTPRPEYVVRGMPNDGRLAIPPDIAVDVASTDSLAGRDPVLARALRGL